MKLYKLTDQNGQSKYHMQWGAGITHTADGKSKVLCNEHWKQSIANRHTARIGLGRQSRGP